MNKPIIAIFCAGNLPTEEETAIINKLAYLPCVILNAETYTSQESLIVDAVIGVVPEHLKHLPDPDTVIAQYEEYLAGTGANVGGNPPELLKDDENEEDNANNASKEPPKATNAFGTPPIPPKDKQ